MDDAYGYFGHVEVVFEEPDTELALVRWLNALARGILVRTKSMRGAAEEAPGAYKDVDAVAEAIERAGLARRVALLSPRVCVKG